MQTKKIFRIGLIVERSRAFGRQLCEGIITYAQNRDDWHLQFMTLGDLRHRHIRSAMDGFIARVTSNAFARLLKSTGKPVVDIYYENPLPGFAVVKTRHESVGLLAAEHFLDRRFKNFAYCPYGGGRTSAYCKKAFVRRLRRAGFGCEVYSSKNEIAYDLDSSDHISDVMAPPKDAKLLEKWLISLPKPVAVFCPSDLRAWQINGICRSAGINVPREVAVLGLDNDIIICGTAKPMLSSIDPNTRKIGHTAAETLADMIDNGIPKRMLIKQIPPTGVVARASSETAPVEPAWLADALVYIQRNAKHGISASDVFETLGRSHTSVTKTFRNILGITVQGEIARTRLEEAKHLLLTTELNISEIAIKSGFSSVTYFLQAFSTAFNVPPKTWRDLQNNQHTRRHT
ncbi:MAG: DNA-binding transcriptional regulator [Kiritimatiellae bacterium]|nr:DNA-binding transcriptional regulator [Kiritimatiellia bacterium]